MAASKSHVRGERSGERKAEQAEWRLRSATPTDSTKECNYASLAHNAVVLICRPKYIFVILMVKYLTYTKCTVM